jgi:hypothetical protein
MIRLLTQLTITVFAMLTIVVFLIGIIVRIV